MRANPRYATLLLAAVLFAAGCGKSEQPNAPATSQQSQSEDQQYVDSMAEQHADDSPVATPESETPPAAEVQSQTVEYATVDGKPVDGYLVWPADAHGALPGVLMFHEWWGLNDNIRHMADQLAAQGYVVLAVDLYHGQVATTPDKAREYMQQAMGNKAALNSNLNQAFKFMKEQTQAVSIGTIGWCFGGTMSLQEALLHPKEIDATVIYYGFVQMADKADLAKLQMPVLGFFGAQDQGIPPDAAKTFGQTMKDLGKSAEIHIYPGAGHAFANPSGESYRPEPAKDAWARTLAFFDRHLQPTAGPEDQ